MKKAGILLCGGQSSRMGRPKAWLPFGKETLLQRTADTLLQVVDTVVVVRAPGQEIPALPGVIRVVEDEATYLGPLNGLIGGLRAVPEVDAVYLSACDAPFLKPEFVQFMLGSLGDFDVAMPRLEDGFYPLSAAYRTTVLPTAEGLVSRQQLRLKTLTDLHSTHWIGRDALQIVDPELQSLFNVNSPEEFASALALFSSSS
jgi:molybdopterin-guanine dinucleotide biosynthesis protein A